MNLTESQDRFNPDPVDSVMSVHMSEMYTVNGSLAWKDYDDASLTAAELVHAGVLAAG